MVFMASRHGFLPEALVSLSALYRKKHVGCIYADRAHGLVLACAGRCLQQSPWRLPLSGEGAQAPKYPAKPGKSRVRHRVGYRIGKSGRRKPKIRSQYRALPSIAPYV
jgi:hypothetical protein